MVSILKKIKSLYKKAQFDSQSIYGKNTKFDACSSCYNHTGQKSSLSIGDDCLIRCCIRIEGDGRVVIGSRTYIGGGSIIGA